MVDSHMHVNFNGWTLQHIIKYLDRERIDCCWLLTWEEMNPGPWAYTHLSVADVWAAYQQYPDRIVPFYAPDPRRPETAELLEQWHARGIRGCGELKATLRWDAPGVKGLLDVAARHSMPVVFHMEESGTRDIPCTQQLLDRLLFYGLRTNTGRYKVPSTVLRLLVRNFAPLRDRKSSYYFPGYMLDFAALESTLSAYPGVNFVAHGPLFWKHISADADTTAAFYPNGPVRGEGLIWRLLREHPNLYADTSARSGFNALSRDSANARRFLAEFQGQLLYGTDNVSARQKRFMGSLGISPETLSSVYAENAIRVLHGCPCAPSEAACSGCDRQSSAHEGSS